MLTRLLRHAKDVVEEALAVQRHGAQGVAPGSVMLPCSNQIKQLSCTMEKSSAIAHRRCIFAAPRAVWPPIEMTKAPH
jgi:hypothetical protein